jgi:hypothetical protein
MRSDKTILKHLHALAAVHNRELTFWRWRIRIFETPDCGRLSGGRDELNIPVLGFSFPRGYRFMRCPLCF